MYNDAQIYITTKHDKQKIIAPVFKEILGAKLLACELDTDTLGTFSGEVARNASALHCAKIKCEWGMKHIGAQYGLSSEGSFGPHPFIPFLPCDHEILYFIDKINDFHLYETILSEKTNYQMQKISSLEELYIFAEKSKFPSHGIIIRPNESSDLKQIFKGITTEDELKSSFIQAQKFSEDKLVWVETDMRAHMNPSRMLIIKDLAIKISKRLATPCPACNSPGWGKTNVEIGLECVSCGFASDLVKAEVFSCQKCSHNEKFKRSDNLLYCAPSNCQYCNP